MCHAKNHLLLLFFIIQARTYTFNMTDLDLIATIYQVEALDENPDSRPSSASLQLEIGCLLTQQDSSTFRIVMMADTPVFELRFSNPPRTSVGFMFGSGANNDVATTKSANGSYNHCAVTFDSQKRLIIRDLNSGAGTWVGYNRLGIFARSGFSWIVSHVDDTFKAKYFSRPAVASGSRSMSTMMLL